MRKAGMGLVLLVAACGGDAPSSSPSAPTSTPSASSPEPAPPPPAQAPSTAPARAPAPPPSQELLLRARLKGLPAAPGGDVVVKARAFPDDRDEVPATVVVSGDSLRVLVPARGFDSAGAVWIVGRVGEASSGTLVFVKSFHGEMDLGDMALGTTAPVLVAGKVLTRARTPAAQAWTCIVVHTAGGEPLAFPDFGVATDASGAFEIRGDVRPSDKPLSVGSIGEWFTPAPVGFTRGSTTVEIPATNTVDVRGEVSLPSDSSLDGLVVGVYPVRGSIDGATVVRAKDLRRANGGVEFRASPSYQITGLAPGDYELHLLIPGASKSLASARVSLDLSFELVKLPQLIALAAVRQAQVRVLTADGHVAAGARLWVRETSERGSFREVPLAADGAAKVPFVGAAVELVACAPGTDFATATAQKGAEATLKLAPAKTTQVTVNLPDGAPRSSNDLGLALRFAWRAPAAAAERSFDLRKDTGDARKLDDVLVEFPATGAAVVTAPRPGWYAVSLVAGSGGAAVERFVAPLRVDGAGPLTLTLPVSAADIGKLFEAAARRPR